MRQARGRLKMTQAELAKRAGVSLQQVQRIESGETKKLQENNLHSYARVLGVDPEYLRVRPQAADQEPPGVLMEEWLRSRLDLRKERHRIHLIETYRVLRQLEELQEGEGAVQPDAPESRQVAEEGKSYEAEEPGFMQHPEQPNAAEHDPLPELQVEPPKEPEGGDP